MAKAKVLKLNTPRNIRLDLTEGEADFILGLLAGVGGDPQKSPRKYADRIISTLEKAAGYNYKDTDSYRLSAGYIHFFGYRGDLQSVSLKDRVLAFLAVIEAIPADSGITPPERKMLEELAEKQV